MSRLKFAKFVHIPKGGSDEHVDAEDQVKDWGRILSSGEISRLYLARVIARQPEVLLMDEPVAHWARNDPKSVLASLHHTAHLLGPVLGYIDANFCKQNTSTCERL